MLVAMASAPFSQLLLASPPGSQHASGRDAAAQSVSRRPDWLPRQRPDTHARPLHQSASAAPLSAAVSERPRGELLTFAPRTALAAMLVTDAGAITGADLLRATFLSARGVSPPQGRRGEAHWASCRHSRRRLKREEEREPKVK